MPAYSKYANTDTGQPKGTSKKPSATTRVGNEKTLPKTHSASLGHALEDATNGYTSKNSKRHRKPSEKVALQAAQQEADNTQRQELARRKAVRAQRNAADTEDEDVTYGIQTAQGSDEGDDNDEDKDEETENMFSSRVVTTRISQKASINKPSFVRSNGRIPISRAVVQEDNEDDDEQGLAIHGRQRSPLMGLDREALKHPRSESTESLREVKVSRTTGGQRPKASDLDDLTKESVIIAISVYRCLVSTANPFPDHAAETQLAREAWDVACEDLDCDLSLTPKLSKLVTNRASHLRGELKTKARPIVETFYNFESGIHKKTIARNRTIAEDLKDGYGYAYKINKADHAERRGLYRNPLIQKIINVMWFRNRQDEGVAYDKYFHPIKAETVALVLTVIDCCIDEWMTGIRTDCAFTTAAYRDIYTEHVRCIKDFESHDKTHGNSNIFDNICEKLYNRGRFHAGAQPISMTRIQAISTSAFDAAIKEYKDDTTTETDGETGIMSDD